MNAEFWNFLQELADTSKISIDRPMGTEHHRYPIKKYPVDYGYLIGTTSIDSSGVDVWVGSLGENRVIGILCTVDLLKKETELKLIIDCTKAEIDKINDFINEGQMRALCILRSF